MKTVNIVSLVVFGASIVSGAEMNRMDEGKRITAEAFALLSKNLGEAIAKDGTAGAIAFCSEKALPLTVTVNAGLRRVSHKARNPKNKADAAELEIIAAYRELLKAGKPLAPQVRKNADGNESFYAPIIIANPLCLKCHGEPAGDIDAATKGALAKLYPNDEATGFKFGELRGLGRVDFRPSTQSK